MNDVGDSNRTMGLFGATGVGVGAIVGGGILALAGTAFATTGPAAMLAFGLNGFIAILTALSFAEMASKFPESGGTYVYSKKVLSVDAAFTVGWVVWFASAVAAVLYAIGFSHFVILIADPLVIAMGWSKPGWMSAAQFPTALAIGITLLLGVTLTRSSSGGGLAVNIGKVLVFGLLIATGLWAVVQQPTVDTSAALRPFFSSGWGGLFQAMGYTFIALQGFDLIAAVAGEVKSPAKNLPRAMVLSLAIALAIYLPLLFVISTVGVTAGENIATAAAADEEGIVASAAGNFLGPFGYWLVLVAAVLSMYSALQANLFAASRIAMAMARDRNLPSAIARLNPKFGTPILAVWLTVGLVCMLLVMLPNVASAGAAASLIFLLTFALAHWISILVRQRSALNPPPYRTKFFPAVPVVGGLACVLLAIFQGITVPKAGFIVMTWLATGGVLFLAIFAGRARIRDASNSAFDPELVTLRGRSPLVLAPLSNPQNAEAMISLANTLVPASIGRVLLQTIVVAPKDWKPSVDLTPVERSQTVFGQLLMSAAEHGGQAEVIASIAENPMQEIARVARLHRCSTVVLGLSDISDQGQVTSLENLVGTLDTDVVTLRSKPGFAVGDAQKILVPDGGRSGHKNLRAMLLSSLHRSEERQITYLRVMPTEVSPEDLERAERNLKRTAVDEVRSPCQTIVLQNDQPLDAIVELASDYDLILLGVQRKGRQKVLGDFTLKLAAATDCPILVLSSRQT